MIEITSRYNIYIYLEPLLSLSSIFGLQPSKTRPFPVKSKGHFGSSYICIHLITYVYIYIYILSHYNTWTQTHYNHRPDYFLINDSSTKMLKHLQALPHGYRVTAEESRKVMKDRFQQMIRLIGLTVVEIVFDRIILRRTQAKCGPCFLSKSQKSYAVFFLCFVKLSFWE